MRIHTIKKSEHNNSVCATEKVHVTKSDCVTHRLLNLSHSSGRRVEKNVKETAKQKESLEQSVASLTDY
jgi:hypothetical protein